MPCLSNGSDPKPQKNSPPQRNRGDDFSSGTQVFLSSRNVIDLDDGKILTGKPYIYFDGKNPWVSGVDFPQQTNPLRMENSESPWYETAMHNWLVV